MNKHILITVFACCYTFLIYAQWEKISKPNIGPPPASNCESYDEYAIGSNSAFYFCRNYYSCGGGGSGMYVWYKIYRTENSGQNWEFMFEDNNIYGGEAIGLIDWYFISGDTGFIHRQDNGWYYFVERTPDGLNSLYECGNAFGFYSVIKMIDFSNMVVAQSNKFMKLENDTFKVIYNFPASDTLYFSKIEATNNDYYLLGFRNGNIDDLIFKSSDGGYNWDTSFYNPVHNITNIKFSSDSIGMMVGNNGLIYKTENAGITWDQKETSINVNLKSIDYLNESTWVVVGDSGKIIMTYDGGTTWFSKASPTNLTLFEVRFPEKDDIVMIRSEESLWKTDINYFNISEQKSLLMNLFPNPAKNKITISSSAIIGVTQLSIFNVSGEKVMERKLTDNETQIDISALPRGVYFVRLQNEKMVEVGKMVKE
jgi:hypothetical protein